MNNNMLAPMLPWNLLTIPSKEFPIVAGVSIVYDS